MGLLNIGKGQGPQIIQLFGRGVRLKGKGMSLKRSERPAYLPSNHSSPGEEFWLQLLEILNIYGIKADYLSKFLEAIRREEAEFETIGIPAQPQYQEKWETLYTLSKPEKRFEEEEILRLEIDDRIYFTVDLLPKVSMYLSKERKEDGIKTGEIKTAFDELRIPEDIIDLLDEGRIWQEIIEFKVQRNYWNLVFEKDMLKNILLSDRYTLLSLPEILEVKDEEDKKQLEDVALLIIKKYLDLFYRKNAKRFESKNLRYDKVRQLPLPPYL